LRQISDTATPFSYCFRAYAICSSLNLFFIPASFLGDLHFIIFLYLLLAQFSGYRSRGIFPSPDALLKSLYLGTHKLEKKWMKVHNWGEIYSQILIIFSKN
jgi:hypothetical protein